MSSLDQFESMFRGADRRRYQYSRIDVRRVLVVTDLPREAADAFCANLQRYLVELEGAQWTTLADDDYGEVDALLAKLGELRPDLIVTYRNVRYGTWRWPYSLGVYLNVLTRQTEYPVLVMPNPHELPEQPWKSSETDRVMVLTDHLVGDDRLLDWGVRMVRPKGTLFLTHVEDDLVFARYVDVIGRLPSIDTDVAREDIKERLLKEPMDYASTCAEVLAEQGHLTHAVEPVVVMGHSLSDYGELIEEHAADLLVMHTKQDDQLALQGKAYSLAVRLRDVPILML